MFTDEDGNVIVPKGDWGPWGVLLLLFAVMLIVGIATH